MGSSIVPQFEELRYAVIALQQRIELLVEYLDRVEKGKIKKNDEILESIQSVTNRLPTITGEAFTEDFNTEMSNGMMMTYLASMTKLGVKVADTMDVHNIVSDGKRGRAFLKRFAG